MRTFKVYFGMNSKTLTLSDESTDEEIEAECDELIQHMKEETSCGWVEVEKKG